MLIGDAALMCGHMLGVRRYLDRCMCWQQNAVTQAGRRRCVCAVFPWPISIDLGDNLLFSFDWARSSHLLVFFLDLEIGHHQILILGSHMDMPGCLNQNFSFQVKLDRLEQVALWFGW